MSRGKLLTVAIGSVVIVVVILLELLSSSANGIGPYQAVLMALGVCILAMGLIPVGHWSGKIVLTVSSVLVTLMLIEGMLMLLNSANVSVTYPDVRELMDDPELGKRTPPDAPGHDARGWRNPQALEQADIVTIGDSQTWGVNASLNETYPSILAELTGQTVYSMAQGSYGAVQYRVLAERAIELSPELVIIGMYFGNDFVDAYTLVYGESVHTDLRDPDFDFRAISQTIAEQARDLQPDNLTTDAQMAETNTTDQSFWVQVQSGTFVGKLLTNVGVFQTINTNVVAQQNQINRDTVIQNPDLFSWYQQDNVVTFFTPAYRQLVVDVESSIVAEGVRITKQQYQEIASLLDEADIELLVVMIPTKEMVYLPYIESDNLNEAYQRLGEQERTLRDEMIALFEENTIAYVDTLPALREAVENDIAIYPQSFDGHPNPNGYRIIAETIAEYIQ